MELEKVTFAGKDKEITISVLVHNLQLWEQIWKVITKGLVLDAKIIPDIDDGELYWMVKLNFKFLWFKIPFPKMIVAEFFNEEDMALFRECLMNLINHKVKVVN